MADWILQAGAVCIALAAIGAAGRKVWQFMRRVDAFLGDWNGEPARPGRKAIPSMPERMAAVEKQVTPNGGDSDSLADRVVRLEHSLGAGPA